jgi:hypothetical protein
MEAVKKKNDRRQSRETNLQPLMKIMMAFELEFGDEE